MPRPGEGLLAHYVEGFNIPSLDFSVGMSTPSLLRAFLPLSLGLPECHARSYTMHKGEGHF